MSTETMTHTEEATIITNPREIAAIFAEDQEHDDMTKIRAEKTRIRTHELLDSSER